MKGPNDRTEAELIADLEDEAAMLQRRTLMLELEIKNLRRDVRRARRNIGYRFVHGIERAVRPILRTFSPNGHGSIHFPRPSHSSGTQPCSFELRRLIDTTAFGLQSAFFTSSTERNWELHRILRAKTQRQLCFGEKEFKSAVATFFSVPEKPIESWEGPRAFAHQDFVVIDLNDPGALWPLLKGRFWPHQKILLHGKLEKDIPSPTQAGPDFGFYATPPSSWLDPRNPYFPPFAPWKSARQRLVSKAPSGHPWPKISVVTPSFNQGKFIADTFESVLGQNYPNLEYLVLDGGSTDETRSILDRYRPRLAYSCSQKDNGQADAINKGFARANGEILAWLNSDDQYAADALMHVANTFDAFPDADIVVGGCGLVQATGSAPERVHHCRLPFGKAVPLPVAQLLDLENCWLKGHFFYQPEVFWRRSIWEAAGAHVSDDLYYCFDYDLWVRMAQVGAKIVHIPELLALYRVHPAQKTYGDDLPYLPELKLVKSRRESPDSRHEPVARA